MRELRPREVTQMACCNTGLRMQVTGIQSPLCYPGLHPSPLPAALPLYLVLISSLHSVYSALLSRPPKHKYTGMCAHTHAYSLGSKHSFLFECPVLSSAFPETAPASILSLKFYLLTICSCIISLF